MFTATFSKDTEKFWQQNLGGNMSAAKANFFWAATWIGPIYCGVVTTQNAFVYYHNVSSVTSLTLDMSKYTIFHIRKY